MSPEQRKAAVEHRVQMVTVIKIVKTCDDCPAQWEGITDDNRQVYARYRWGCLSVSIGAVGDMSDFGGVAGKQILFVDKNEEYHGSMEYSELKELSKEVLALPALESEHIDWQTNDMSGGC